MDDLYLPHVGQIYSPLVPGSVRRALSTLNRFAEAKRLLDYRVEHAPEEYRESTLRNVRLNRAIMEAWEEHGRSMGASMTEVRTSGVHAG